MKLWLSQHTQAVRLTLHVQPGAKKTECAGEHGDALKIRLNAPPVDGKANHALIAWLAKQLGCPKRNITLLSGEKSRHKIIEISTSLTPDEVLIALGYLCK
ncbi:DUF167 domain-containing protein [Craterilacuibacter sp. RT1T]|uniref:DUF167 domain-containing protein n=1 Tax=Craterilacuibacter sp. RT1T TaxID=2942211 RepID=UPI0020C0A701|nr:DUF167 domain-containing protein [Craterilacuibacter sp. RT1T]MCL6263971.1 DUF167 domain-containing protein [Craterilacuibacter sp. RT1T]